MRALDLLTAMVSKRNLESIVKRLIAHLDTTDGAYSDQVLERILFICSQESFSFIEDFEWYLSTLVDLTHLKGVSRENAKRLSDDILSVVVRVPGLRKFAVDEMVKMLLSERLLQDSQFDNKMTDVLQACAWLVGEFSRHLTNQHLPLLKCLIRPVAGVSGRVQTSFIHNAMKILCAGLSMKWKGCPQLEHLDATAQEEKDRAEAEEGPPSVQPFDIMDDWLEQAQEMLAVVIGQLPSFCQSADVQVQERAVSYLAFVNWFRETAGFVEATTTAKPAPEAFSLATLDSPKAAAVPVAQLQVPWTCLILV